MKKIWFIFFFAPLVLFSAEQDVFEVALGKAGVSLNWSSASENTNEYFILERSKNGLDFEFLAQIKAAGNNGSETNYLETDFNPIHGLSYYRLKRVDKGGSVQLTLLRSIEYREEGQLYVFPNQNSDEFKVKLNARPGEEVLVVIADAAGKQEYSKVLLTQEGGTYLGIDLMGTIEPGYYWVIASSRQNFYRAGLLIK